MKRITAFVIALIIAISFCIPAFAEEPKRYVPQIPEFIEIGGDYVNIKALLDRDNTPEVKQFMNELNQRAGLVLLRQETATSYYPQDSSHGKQKYIGDDRKWSIIFVVPDDTYYQFTYFIQYFEPIEYSDTRARPLKLFSNHGLKTLTYYYDYENKCFSKATYTPTISYLEFSYVIGSNVCSGNDATYPYFNTITAAKPSFNNEYESAYVDVGRANLSNIDRHYDWWIGKKYFNNDEKPIEHKPDDPDDPSSKPDDPDDPSSKPDDPDDPSSKPEYPKDPQPDNPFHPFDPSSPDYDPYIPPNDDPWNDYDPMEDIPPVSSMPDFPDSPEMDDSSDPFKPPVMDDSSDPFKPPVMDDSSDPFKPPVMDDSSDPFKPPVMDDSSDPFKPPVMDDSSDPFKPPVMDDSSDPFKPPVMDDSSDPFKPPVMDDSSDPFKPPVMDDSSDPFKPPVMDDSSDPFKPPVMDDSSDPLSLESIFNIFKDWFA